MTHRFKKGDLVRWRADIRENEEVRMRWGLRERAWRPMTLLTHDEWLELSRSPAYQGLDDAGETRIVPRVKTVDWSPSDIYVVVRARARPPRGYGSRMPYTLVLSTTLGRELYIKREALEPVE